MPLDLSRVRALCFDVDGTLSDTDDLFVIKLADWLRPWLCRFRADPGQTARRIVMATEGIGAFLMGVPDRLGFDHYLVRFNQWLRPVGPQTSSPGFLLIPGTREMLAQLSGHYPMAIVSARGQYAAHTFLQQYRLAPYFRCVVTAQTCQYTKPFPHPIRWAAREMGVRVDQCVMIGDTVTDIRAGKQAGAQTVGVLCGFGKEADLRRAGADLIVECTTQLGEIFMHNIPDGGPNP